MLAPAKVFSKVQEVALAPYGLDLYTQHGRGWVVENPVAYASLPRWVLYMQCRRLQGGVTNALNKPWESSCGLVQSANHADLIAEAFPGCSGNGYGYDSIFISLGRGLRF